LARARKRTAAFKKAYRFARKVFIKFSDDRGNMLAAGLSFYALISLAPLLLLAAGIFAHLLGSPQSAYTQVSHYISRLSPALVQEKGTGIRDLLQQLIAGKDIAWGIGGVGLAWSASQLFVSLETAMNLVWKARERRGFIKKRLIAFGMILIVGMLFLVAMGISTAAHIVRNWELPALGLRPADVTFAWNALAAALPPFLAFLMFLVVYQVMPNSVVPFRCAAVGAATSAALWEIARGLFGWYAVSFADFNRIYGPITIVIVLALWIYYSALVSILGAEVGAVYKEEAG